MLTKIRNILLTAILLFVYHLVEACSVCGTDYSDEEIKAYTFITFLLILLPIGSFTFLGIWLGRKYWHYNDEDN